MKSKKLKLLVTLLLSVVVVFSLTAIVRADTPGTGLDTNQFTISDSTSTSATLGVLIGGIINVVQVIGVGVAIIMLTVLAIKYISAAPSDKAEIKKHAVIYVVGAIVLFAATGILQLVKQFAGIINDNVSDSGSSAS